MRLYAKARNQAGEVIASVEREIVTLNGGVEYALEQLREQLDWQPVGEWKDVTIKVVRD